MAGRQAASAPRRTQVTPAFGPPQTVPQSSRGGRDVIKAVMAGLISETGSGAIGDRESRINRRDRNGSGRSGDI